jgi:DNA polymerase-1
MFPAGEGRVIVSMDFASQEVVLTACAAQDPEMLRVFSSTPRLDFHSMTSSAIAHTLLPRLGLPSKGVLSYEEFVAGLHGDDEQIKAAYKTIRNKYAKQLAFGIIYGSSALGVAENMQIPKELAEQLVAALFARYPRIPAWQREVALFAREHGYVEMPFGSRRHAVADLYAEERKLSGRQERQLSNAIIQSGAAEILKVVRQRMFDARMRERYELTQIFPIYDEVTACVPVEKCESYILELADIMRITPPGYPIGMEVEASVGKTWGSQLEIGTPTKERIQATLAEVFSNGN